MAKQQMNLINTQNLFKPKIPQTAQLPSIIELPLVLCPPYWLFLLDRDIEYVWL